MSSDITIFVCLLYECLIGLNRLPGIAMIKIKMALCVCVCQNDEVSLQRKVRTEVIQLEDTLAQVRKEYEMLRIEFEQTLAANEQAGNSHFHVALFGVTLCQCDLARCPSALPQFFFS